MTQIVVLISGRGSNMQAIVEACRNNQLDASVCAVISNNPDAAGLVFARDQGIETRVIDHKAMQDRAAFDAALHEALEQYQPDWIAFAGFMRILGTDVVNAWRGKMINIHPSLLPLYPGLNTHARAIAAGDKQHGATVHFVTPELDAGQTIACAAVDIKKDDSTDTLAARVLEQEHSLYVSALRQCIAGTAQLGNLT